jgi:hypothetical protein
MPFVLLIVAKAAMACPDLTGQFACITDDMTEDLTIRQTLDGYLPSYDMNGAKFLVDNQDHQIASDDPGFKNAVVHISCTETTLSRHLTADFFDNQVKVGSIDTTLEFSVQNNALVEVTSGKMTNSQGDTPLDDQITCKRESL